MKTAYGFMAAAVLLTASGGAAGQIRATEEPARSELVLDFTGGDVGRDMARALTALEAEGALPTTIVALPKGKSPCQLLSARGLPPACTAYTPLLQKLNPGVNFNAMPAGAPLRMPDVSVQPRRVARTYSTDNPSEMISAKELLNNWSTKGARLRSQGAVTRVFYDAYKLVVPSPSDERTQVVAERLETLRSRNLDIQPVFAGARDAEVFSWSSTDVLEQCQAQGSALPNRRYDELVDADVSALRHLAQRPAEAPAPTVVVVDTPIAPAPNLLGALAGGATGTPTGGWTCTWRAARRADHGTHMAGIIASRNNRGFVGVAEAVQIESFPWLIPSPAGGELKAPGDRVERLVNLLEEREQFEAFPRNIFLVASEFDPPPASAVQEGQLVDPAARANRKPARQLKDYDTFVVAAAGQRPDSHTDGALLHERYRLSPQNLGDWENVLVVTACEVCGRGQTRLMKNAGQSPTAVHVAAPGGTPVAGWLDEGHVGAMAGTSQAAAYVAGVAAAMVGRHPHAYTAAKALKLRLQVTAWPLVDDPDAPSGQASRLAVGVVDPVLAQLDPRRHWIKRPGGWEPVRLRAPLNPLHLADGAGDPPAMPARVIRRFVRIQTGDAERYALLTTGTQEGAVGRYGPLSLANPDAALATCDGDVPLADVLDLIVALQGVSANECSR